MANKLQIKLPGCTRKSLLRISCCITFLCILTAISALGCKGPGTADPYAPGIFTERFAEYSVLGQSVEGRHIEVLTLGNGSETVFILATIHGDEPVGTPLLNTLANHLLANSYLLKGRKVVLLPIANPDGFAQNTRENANSVDLNRNFDTANRTNKSNHGTKGLSEPESKIIYELINTYRPSRIISIHQPYACIDYDGPGAEIAAAMAWRCPLPLKKLGALPGSLGSYAGLTLNIPIITMELRKNDHKLTQQQLWQLYGSALLAVITYPE